MNEANLKGKKLSLTIKKKKEGGEESQEFLNPGVVDIITRTSKFSLLTRDADLMASEAWKLFKQQQIPIEDVRGIGLHMSVFEEPVDPNLTSQNKTLDNYFTKVSKDEIGQDKDSLQTRQPKKAKLKQATLTSLFAKQQK